MEHPWCPLGLQNHLEVSQILAWRLSTEAISVLYTPYCVYVLLTRSLAGIALVQTVAAAPLFEPSSVVANGGRHRRGGLNPHLVQLRIFDKIHVFLDEIDETNENDASKQQQTAKTS